MKSIRPFLESPATFLSGLGLAIFVLGASLTSPIWFLVDGLGPVAAMRAGRPYQLAGIAGLVMTIAIGIVTHRLRRAEEPQESIASMSVPTPDENDWKHRLVHLLVVLMFVVPFLTIVLGLILNQVVSADAG